MKKNTYGFYVTTHNNDMVWLDFGNDARRAWKAFYESARKGEEDRELFRDNDVIAFYIENANLLWTRSNTGKYSRREEDINHSIWKTRHDLYKRRGGNYAEVSDAICHYFFIAAR